MTTGGHDQTPDVKPTSGALMFDDIPTWMIIPTWMMRPSSVDVIRNTVGDVVDIRVLSQLVGIDANRLIIGLIPVNFTTRGILEWIRFMAGTINE